MKWNTEWVDLQTIDRMVAECWRLNDTQLKDYARQLRQQKDLSFTSHLGVAFLDILDEMAAGRKPKEWSGIQKDVKALQGLITRGLQWDEDTWKNEFRERSEDPSFQKGLRQAFLELLEERLELRLSVGQKQLRRDVEQIERLCERYVFESTEQFQTAADFLQQQQDQLFKTWLGEAFSDQVRLESKRRAKQTKKIARLATKKTVGKENIILDAAESEHLELEDEEYENALLENDGPDGISLNQVYMEAMQMADEYNHKTEPDLLSQLKEDGKTKKGRKRKERRKRGKKAVSGLAVAFAVLVICILAGGIWLVLQKDTGFAAERLQQLLHGMVNMETIVETAALDEEHLSSTEKDRPVEVFRETMEAGLSTLYPAASDEVFGKEAEKDLRDEGVAISSNNQKSPMDVQPDTGSYETKPLPDILEKYHSFAESYPDVYGWLSIPGTEIDQPVMQCKEDVTDYFYLHHNYRGQETDAGSLFVDSKSNIYPQDQNTVIYGHNMQNGHNFGILTNYEDPDFYQTHKLVHFDTIYETGLYEIVAVAKTRVLYQDEKGFRYYYLFNYNDRDTYQECKRFIEKNKLYDTGLSLKKSDQTIMLSTCEYSIENGRLVVIARRK